LEAAGVKIQKIQNPVHAHLWSRVRFSLPPPDCIWILFSLKKRYRQRWDRIRSSGVDSGRILRFSFGPGFEVKNLGKTRPGFGSLFNFGSSRSLCGHSTAAWTCSRVRRRPCQIAEVQTSRGFGMQQTKRRRTDLAHSTNYNIQKTITTRKIEVWQSWTHRKCQTEYVHLHKTDKMPNRRGAK